MPHTNFRSRGLKIFTYLIKRDRANNKQIEKGGGWFLNKVRLSRLIGFSSEQYENAGVGGSKV